MNVTTQRAGEERGGQLAALVQLVQGTYPETSVPGDERGLARFELAWFQNRAPRRRGGMRVLVASMAMAVIVLGAAGLLTYRHFDKLTYQVVNGSLGPEGLVRAGAAGGTAIQFSEGSEIALADSARARIDGTTANGGRVVVESGKVHANIVHRKNTKWVVAAGPYTIRVTGTAFDVKWSWRDERLDIHMDRGSVVVTGPLAPAGVTLTTGMRLSANPSGGLSIGGNAGNAGDAGASGIGTGQGRREDDREGMHDGARGGAAGEALDSSMSLADRGRGSARLRAAAAVRHADRKVALLDQAGQGQARSAESWDRRLARGDGQGILDDAEAQGTERVLATATIRDLSALADAARYGHRAALARRALLAMRERFSGLPEARDAAFFLGGLAEDAGTADGQNSAALDWYDRYLGENSRGRYAAQALGRKMVMTQKLKGIEAARPIADEYLSRFPDGPYTTAAHKVMRAP
jgi:hypothetical protein